MEHTDDIVKRTHHVPLIRQALEGVYGEGKTVDIKDHGAHTTVEFHVHDGLEKLAIIQVGDPILVDSRSDRALEDAAVRAAHEAPPASRGYVMLVTDQSTGGIAIHVEQAQRNPG